MNTTSFSPPRGRGGPSATSPTGQFASSEVDHRAGTCAGHPIEAGTLDSRTGVGIRERSRRQFLGEGVASVVGVAAMVTRETARAAIPSEENPWRYDVDRLRQVDPDRVGFERVGGFAIEGGGPRRVVWGPAGEVWVAAGKGVRRFAPEGRRTGEIEVGEAVRAMAITGDQRVLIGLRDRIEIFDFMGRRQARWGPFAGKAFLTGLAVSGGDVYVADSGNRVVYRLDSQGKIELRLGEKSVDRGIPGLVLPSPFLDVEVGEDGLLRINNPGRHRVETYTRDGDLERSWGRPGVALDGFCGCCNPVAIAMFPDGRVATAEKGLPRVKVFGVDGRLETVVAGPASFAPVGSEERGRAGLSETAVDGLDVAVAADGRVAVLDLPGQTVQIFRRKSDSATRG